MHYACRCVILVRRRRTAWYRTGGEHRCHRHTHANHSSIRGVLSCGSVTRLPAGREQARSDESCLGGARAAPHDHVRGNRADGVHAHRRGSVDEEGLRVRVATVRPQENSKTNGRGHQMYRHSECNLLCTVLIDRQRVSDSHRPARFDQRSQTSDDSKLSRALRIAAEDQISSSTW